jgi:cell division septum initiation protein DivIVA
MPPARRNSSQESLAGTAGDRVRAIIEAAETSAAEIRAEAEAEAERIRARAEEGASVLRREVRGDVQALVGSIREAVDRLRADLDRLEERLGEPEPGPGANPAGGAAGDSEEEPDIALAEDAAVGLDEPDAGGGDVEAARLVALNMALDGASRDDVAQHLRDNYKLADPSPLLDEVFASIG